MDPADTSWLDEYAGRPPPRPSLWERWEERQEELRRTTAERLERRRAERAARPRKRRGLRATPLRRRGDKPKAPSRPEPGPIDDYSGVPPPPPRVAKRLKDEPRPTRKRTTPHRWRRALGPRRVKGLSRLTVLAAAALGATFLLVQWFGIDPGGSERAASSSLVPGKVLGSTAGSLTAGPYFPVHGKFYYGESGARFGASRGGRRHEGQDVFARQGTPLIAVRNGVVVDRGGSSGQYAGGRGNYMAIYSPEEGRSYVYLHMLRAPKLNRGDEVKAGQEIGQMGCSGSCFGVHLHFEIRIGRASLRSDTRAIDPLPFLKEWDKTDRAALKTSYGRL